MNKTACLHTLILVSLLPVFSTNAMDAKPSGNGASQNSNTVNPNQQVSSATHAPDTTILASATRYVWKKYTAEGSRAIIGLGDKVEKENTIAIYKSAKEKTGKEPISDVLKKQLFERQQLTQDFVLSLMEKYNKKTEYIPLDIKDGLALCLLDEVDAVLTSDMHTKLKSKLKELITSLIADYNSMIIQLDPQQEEEEQDDIHQTKELETKKAYDDF